MAFKIAASIVSRSDAEGRAEINEPIMSVEVVPRKEYVGDVIVT
jgi:translation elongation factor EF-G